MGLYNDEEVTGVRWFKVHGVPENFDKVALYDNDVYLPIEALNLTRENFIAYMTEYETGTALVTRDGRIFASGATVLDMCVKAQPDKVDEMEECLSRIFTKAVESELIQNPINEKLL